MRLVRVAVNAEQLLYRSPGGIGRYTAQLLTVLPDLFPEDEVVSFVARHPRSEVVDRMSAAGVDAGRAGRAVILPLPRPLLYEGWLLGPGLPRLPGMGVVDVIHAPSVAVPPPGRVPLVVTVHDVAPELFPDAFPARGRRFHRRGLAAAARRADVVVTVSEAAAAEIAGHSSIPADRIRVVPNGVQPASVAPERRGQLLDGWRLTDRPFVLWVGSLEPRKGVGTLVAAMARLARAARLDGTALVLAGYPGWLGADLVADEDRAALGDSLVQLGQVSEDALWTLYQEATLFAFPSRHEGFGLPVVEAMSQATAVVAADIPALREVTGGAARLVPPGDVPGWAEAIGELLADEAARAGWAAAGAARAQTYSAAATMRTLRGIYAEVARR
jgi:glycosyltransferase involved in cell wall biosynthesis